MKTISQPLSELKSHYDVVVVGTGYGAGVSAARMARTGKSVCVLERGEEILPGDYPNSLSSTQGHVQVNTRAAHLGSPTGMFDFHMGEGMNALVGCGFGGTSLINANVALKVEKSVIGQDHWPKAFRDDPNLLEPYYEKATHYLGSTPYPNNDKYPKPNKLKALEKSAQEMNQNCYTPPINVNFEDQVNPFGVEQRACTNCGDCCSGCNYGSKNTTLMNYLPDAKKFGAEFFRCARVQHVTKSEGKWQVNIVENKKESKEKSPGVHVVTADVVILGAGSLGSTEILLKSREQGLTLSDRIGKHFSGNGDVLAFGYNNYWHMTDGKPDPVYGIGIGENDDLPREKWPGPCITGVIDMRSEDVVHSLVIEEGVIPGALSMVIPPGLFFGDVEYGKFLQYGTGQAEMRLKDAKALGETILENPEKMGDACYQNGPISRTQTYLVMSHDDAGGELKLNGDRVRIKWPDCGQSPVIKRDNDLLAEANKAIEGQFVPNPLWSEPVGDQLITVHPVGGCSMADDASAGVVNDKCQVYSGNSGTDVHEGLYVCDGAVLPGSVGVNPLLTISAIAERANDLLAKDRGWTIDKTMDPAQPITLPPLVPKNHRSSQNSDQDEHHGIADSLADGIKKLIKALKDGAISEFEKLLHWLIEKYPDSFSPSMSFTETMHGFYSMAEPDLNPPVPHEARISTDFGLAFKAGEAANRKMSFKLTIKAKDLNKLTEGKDHSAVATGTVSWSEADEPMPVKEGEFHLLPPDKDRVETWLMTYRLKLDDGKEGLFFEGTKYLHEKEGSHFFTDLTRLYVNIYEGSDAKGKLVARSILNLDLEDLMMQLSTVDLGYPEGHWLVKELEKHFDAVKSAVDLIFMGKFAGFFAGTVFESYGGLLADLKNFPRTEDEARIKANPRKPNVPEPVVFDIDLGDGFKNKLTRYKGGELGPVILAPGFPVTGSSFAINTVDKNLVEFLATDHGYDVFCYDYRASPESGSTKFDYTIDSIVKEDWPAAIKKVIEVSGKPDVQVIAHCIGSMTLLMSMLNGTKGVRSMISSQVTLHPVTNWFNYLKADINLTDILVKALEKEVGDGSKIPLRSIASLSEKEAKKAGYKPKDVEFAGVVDVLCWNLPVPPGEACKNPCCRRIFSVFGPSYLHDQLNHDTHIAMREWFGPAPTRPFKQLTKIFENGYVVDEHGANSYLPNVENLKLPISFIAGERNQLILPETSARTYEWLCHHNGSEHYDRKVFAEYGHMDFFIGKNAARDIYPSLLEMLAPHCQPASSNPVR